MIEAATLAALLRQRAFEHPDALAFSLRGETLSYRALHADAERIAASLRRDGIERGDRVAIVLPAGLDLVRLFYALQRLGAVPCIFDPHVPEATTARRVEAIRPRKRLSALPSAPGGSLPGLPDDTDALAVFQPTSGTSGEPRVVMLKQRQVMAALRTTHDLIAPTPADVMVGWVPPWHDLGLHRFVVAPVAFGLPCHLVPPSVKTIPEWLATISSVRATITGAPDFAWMLATRLVDPANVDLRSLRVATNGGEPVRATTIAAFESRFGLGHVVLPGYGLAEATLGVASARPGEPLRVDGSGSVSCGRPLAGIEVRIEQDEILVRGPAVFAGYFDAPQASAQSLESGWLRTGDAGALDDRGELYVLGRRRAMIKRGGATLAPRELEEAAQSVPGVRLAAAVGIDSGITEEIVVVVEADAAVSALESSVRAAIERALGSLPVRVLVQPPRSIPRTYNGKIRHAALRDQILASKLRINPSVVSDGDSTR